MTVTTTTALLLGVFTSAMCAAAATKPNNGVLFLFPTSETTLHYNDYVQVQYQSGFKDPWMYTFCLDGGGHTLQKQSQSVGGLNNTATVKLDWPGSDSPCWFDLKPNKTAAVGVGGNSDHWTFDVVQRAATTVGPSASSTSSSATGTGTSPAVAATTTATTATSTSTSTPGNDSESGLSTGAKAGVGIGVAIGVLILVFAGTFLNRRRRRAKTAAARTEVHESGPGAGEAKYPGNYPAYDPSYAATQQKPSQLGEMDGSRPAVHELHTPHEIYEMPARAD